MKATLNKKSVSVDKLIPNPKNPRIDLRPGMPLYEKLKDSLIHHEYVEPIVWNQRTGYIVSGHQRLQVMKDIAEEKGDALEEVEVIVVDMPENKADTLMVAINKITGLWDQEKLEALFKELSEEDLGYTGYDDFEIQALLGNAESEDYSEEGFEEYIDNANSQIKSYNVILSCIDEKEQEFVKKLLKEDDRLKRGYKVSELMERFDEE